MVEFTHLDYCGNCTARLTKVNETKYQCNTCGVSSYNNPSAASGVLVFRGDTVLLSIRGMEPDIGKLDVVGGFIDYMEQPIHAAEREFEEETGTKIRNLRLVESLTAQYTKNGCASMFAFVGEIDDDAKLVPDDDVAELVWRDIDSLKDSDFGYPGVVAMIKRAHQRS